MVNDWAAQSDAVAQLDDTLYMTPTSNQLQEPNFHDDSCSRTDNHSSVSSATSPAESSLDNGKKNKQKLLHKTPNSYVGEFVPRKYQCFGINWF